MPGTVLRAEASEEGAESLCSSSSDGRSRHANKSAPARHGEWRRRREQCFVGARRTEMVPEPSGDSSEASLHLGLERSMRSYRAERGRQSSIGKYGTQRTRDL